MRKTKSLLRNDDLPLRATEIVLRVIYLPSASDKCLKSDAESVSPNGVTISRYGNHPPLCAECLPIHGKSPPAYVLP